MGPNLTIPVQPLSPLSPSLTDSVCHHREERWIGQSRRLTKGRNGGSWFLDGPGLHVLHSPSNSVWIYYSPCREGLRNSGFLEEGNEQSLDQIPEETLEITREAASGWWLTCLSMSCGLKFHFVFIIHTTRITAPGRATSCIPFGLSKHPK